MTTLTIKSNVLVYIFIAMTCSIITLAEESGNDNPNDIGANDGVDNPEKRMLTGRISGGDSVAEFQLPSMLYIRNYNSKEFVCGAVLVNISDIQLVLTAASCIWTGIPDPRFSTIPLEDLEIVGGTLSKSDHPLHAQTRKAKSAIIHHMYEPDSVLNDIAIIHIYPNFLETKALQPIPMAEKDYPLPATVEVFGWGMFNSTGPYSDTLRHTELPTMTGTECKDKLKMEFNEGQFCGIPVVGQENCLGDSGGPVISKHESKHNVPYLVGIQTKTLNFNCGNNHKPVVFTRVVMYKRWMLYKAQDFNKTLEPESDENVPVP